MLATGIMGGPGIACMSSRHMQIGRVIGAGLYVPGITHWVSLGGLGGDAILREALAALSTPLFIGAEVKSATTSCRTSHFVEPGRRKKQEK